MIPPPSRHDIIAGVVLGPSAGGNPNFKDVQTPLGTYRRVPSPGGHHTPGTSVFVGIHDPHARRRPVVLGSRGGILTDDGELDSVLLTHWATFAVDLARSLVTPFPLPDMANLLFADADETARATRRIVRTVGTVVATLGGDSTTGRTTPGTILLYDLAGPEPEVPRVITLTGTQCVADLYLDSQHLYVGVWNKLPEQFVPLTPTWHSLPIVSVWPGASRIQKYALADLSLVWERQLPAELRLYLCPSVAVLSTGAVHALCFRTASSTNYLVEVALNADGTLARQTDVPWVPHDNAWAAWVASGSTGAIQRLLQGGLSGWATTTQSPVTIVDDDPQSLPVLDTDLTPGYIQDVGPPNNISGDGTPGLGTGFGWMPLSAPADPIPSPGNQIHQQVGIWNWVLDETNGLHFPVGRRANQVTAFKLSDGTRAWALHGTNGQIPTPPTSGTANTTLDFFTTLGLGTNSQGQPRLLVLRERVNYLLYPEPDQYLYETIQAQIKQGATTFPSSPDPAPYRRTNPLSTGPFKPIGSLEANSSENPGPPQGAFDLPAAPGGLSPPPGVEPRRAFLFWTPDRSVRDDLADLADQVTELYLEIYANNVFANSRAAVLTTGVHLHLLLLKPEDGTILATRSVTDAPDLQSSVRVRAATGTPELITGPHGHSLLTGGLDIWTPLGLRYGNDQGGGEIVCSNGDIITDTWAALITEAIYTGGWGEYRTDNLDRCRRSRGAISCTTGAWGTTAEARLYDNLGIIDNNNVAFPIGQRETSRRWAGQGGSPLEPGGGVAWLLLYGVRWASTLHTVSRQAPCPYHPLRVCFPPGAAVFAPRSRLYKGWGIQDDDNSESIPASYADRLKHWRFESSDTATPFNTGNQCSNPMSSGYSKFNLLERRVESVSVSIAPAVISYSMDDLSIQWQTPWPSAPIDNGWKSGPVGVAGGEVVIARELRTGWATTVPGSDGMLMLTRFSATGSILSDTQVAGWQNLSSYVNFLSPRSLAPRLTGIGDRGEPLGDLMLWAASGRLLIQQHPRNSPARGSLGLFTTAVL